MTITAQHIDNLLTRDGSVRADVNRGTWVHNGRAYGLYVGQHPASGSLWITWGGDRQSFAVMCDRLDAITLKHAEKYLCPADEMHRYNDCIYANPFNINCKGTLLKPRSRERASTTGHFKNGKIALVAYFSGYSYTEDAYVRNRKVVLYMPQGDDERRASFDLDGYGDRYERSDWKSNVFMMIQDRSERNNLSMKECYDAGDLMFEIEDGGFYGPLEMDLTITAKIDLSENSIFSGKYRELI